MKEFSSMAVRIAGLFLIVFTLAHIPVHTMAYTIRPEYGILSYSLPSIIPFLAGILLYRFPDTVSKAFVNVAPDSFKIEKPKELIFIGSKLIGIVFFFFSLSDLAFHLSTALSLYFSSNYELSLLTFDYPSAIATVVEFMLSLALIFKTNLLLSFTFKGFK